MSLLSIDLAEEDLAFLKVWASEHGTSAEAFLAEQARNLRHHLQSGLNQAVRNATGIISNQADLTEEHLQHLERKHA